MKLAKTYDASAHEADLYKLWETSGIFMARPDKDLPRYSIAMPPPNATGSLHVGHSLFITLQDILARYARAQGYDVLWLPGTDHAALPTNAIMEKQLADEGTDKHKIGREAFVARLQEFIENSRHDIRSQLRLMGASCDWSRERYTLDDALNRCVNETFVKMYQDGLIYRGHRIVNWDPKLETTLADDEVVRQEEKAKFYTFKYGPFLIGTARPETKFGDKYVVMHPDDKRYSGYKEGDQFEAEWINGKVTATVIKDSAVDPKFGTGVMTITPWHDHTDFDIAERHGLDKEQIIDYQGKLMPIAAEFAGLPIEKARPLIVEKLKSKGLLVSVDDNYLHNVAINDRGKGIIEPQIMLQWFVDVNKKVVDWKGKKLSLKQVMHDVVTDGDIDIIPERFNKVYFHWIDNLRDWCISRQIWWGHRIPVWYKKTGSSEDIYVGVQPPTGDGWVQDNDTLDTWFSSALWTWSTLIDPKLAEDYSLSLDQILKASRDFQTYHPTTVMETGWDILFFWVARMILATTYMVHQVPFKTVYLHGLIRTEEGHKMSKSRPETMVNPVEVIPEYGTDALRLALVHGTSAGNDQVMSISRIVAQRNFCNKLWNIARFTQETADKPAKKVPNSIADDWILTKLNLLNKTLVKDLDGFRFGDAYDKLYHFIWNDLADWYVEASKVETNPVVLIDCLKDSLIMAHPFAPFVTEAIWQSLKLPGVDMLATAKWPKLRTADATKAKQFEQIKDLVSEIRYLSHALKVRQPVLSYIGGNNLAKHSKLIKKLANLGQIDEVKSASNGIKLQTKLADCWLEIDRQKITQYLDELKQQREDLVRAAERLKVRLANRAYVKNAPASIVSQTKEDLKTTSDELTAIDQEFQRFSKVG